jgi:SAM-dependent methyltransferase
VSAPGDLAGVRRPGWWIERTLLVVATVLMVAGAGTESGRVVFVVAGGFAALLVGLAWHRGDVTAREVLMGAVLLRLIAFPLLPGLSDDGFRYVWDGMLQVEGINPYAHRPSDPALAGFHDGVLYGRLNSADYYSVYPPASQLVFAAGGALGWPLGWYAVKATFVGMETAGVWALARMAPARLVLLYAWHPLAVIEVAGQGHTEGGMVCFLLLAVLAYRRRRPAPAVAALTVAGWFKLYPFLLVPFLLRRVGWRYGWAVAAVSAVFVIPYTHPSVLMNVVESLDLYVRRFEFYAGPYYALKAAGRLLTGGDVSKTLGPLLSVTLLVGTAALFVAERSRRPALPSLWLGVITLVWATATTVHPWYLLGALALLPLRARGRAEVVGWYALALGGMGTYLLYTHGEGLYWAAVWVGWAVWAGALGMASCSPLLQSVIRNRAIRKWGRLEPRAQPVLPARHPARVLDLGAGEGYVGESAQQRTNAEVVLADVADFNRTALPLVVYDGRTLPFAASHFDLTLLVFVLHHAADPDAVLREAYRVTRGRVLVLESVFERPWERRWLEAADRLANRLRGGGAMREQEAHLRFRSAVEWRRACERAGFRVLEESAHGGWWHRKHLLVLARL